VADNDWRSHERWRAILERRLNEIGSMVKGNQSFQADRISDVIEQIDEIRKEFEDMRADIEEFKGKVREYVKENVPKGGNKS